MNMDVRSGAKIVGLLAVVVVGCEYLPSMRQPLARPEVAGDVHINDGLYAQTADGESSGASELARLIERDVQALQNLQSQQPTYRRQQEQMQARKSPDMPIQESAEVAQAKPVEWQKPIGRISIQESKRIATGTPEPVTIIDVPDETTPSKPAINQGFLAKVDSPRPVGSVTTAEANQQPSNSYSLSDALRQMIVDFRGEVFHHSSYSNNPLRELLVLAALPLIDPDGVLSQGTIEAINGLTDGERKIFERFQDFFAQLGQELANGSDSEEAVVTGITELLASLSTEPQLELHHPMLCTSVSGFGAYKAFGKNTAGGYAFLSQTKQQAVVYIEVDNFTSELNENSKWVTKLSQKLVIYNDRDGLPVWKQDWRPVVDVTENKRKDFFVVQVITLTERLGLGRYQLKISLRDELSGAESETAIELEMVADPSLVTAGQVR